MSKPATEELAEVVLGALNIAVGVLLLIIVISVGRYVWFEIFPPPTPPPVEFRITPDWQNYTPEKHDSSDGEPGGMT